MVVELAVRLEISSKYPLLLYELGFFCFLISPGLFKTLLFRAVDAGGARR